MWSPGRVSDMHLKLHEGPIFLNKYKHKWKITFCIYSWPKTTTGETNSPYSRIYSIKEEFASVRKVFFVLGKIFITKNRKVQRDVRCWKNSIFTLCPINWHLENTNTSQISRLALVWQIILVLAKIFTSKYKYKWNMTFLYIFEDILEVTKIRISLW